MHLDIIRQLLIMNERYVQHNTTSSNNEYKMHQDNMVSEWTNYYVVVPHISY